MRRTGPWLLALLVWFVAVPVEAGEETLVSLPTRDGVVQSFLLREAHAPAGVVVLLAGGHGRLGLADRQHGVEMDGGHDNFLVRSRALFAAHGYTAILVDAPSDRQGEEGMFGGFRGEEAHASDLGIVLDWVAGRYGLPVWLVGTSRGTESVAAFARRAGTRIEGLVLSAPVTRTTRRGVSLLEYPLERIHVPVMIVAHRRDGCRSTPPEGIEELRAALIHAPRVRVQWWDGGDPPRGEPCEGLTPHGFLGLEEEVVRAMVHFMKTQ